MDELISREYLINKIGSVDGLEGVENSNLFAKHYMDIVKGAPLVQPTRPTGKWIDIQYFKNDDTYYRPKCPFCSIEPKEYSNFCPNCGARMTESEEEE